MFACHLAIPIIFPVKEHKHKETILMFSMWPLRSITVHDGKTDTSIVNCKQNIVSFIRLGRPQISKSKLANELLYGTAHNAFFNYDCILGSSEKQASVGLVEASWFLPSPKQPRNLQRVTIFLNLRGDALNNAEQTEYLKSVSHVMIIVTDKETMKNKKDLDYFKRAHFNVLFLLTGEVSKDFIRKYKQYYMDSSPDGFNAEFISGSEHCKNIGLSEVKEAIANKIGPLLNGMSSAKTIQEMCEQARTMGITVDEDMPKYKNGRKAANKIFDQVKDCPLADIKVKYTPLQKENWQIYTDVMKSYRKPGSDFQEKAKLEQKMILQQTKQWDSFKTGKPFIKDFISILLTLDGDSLVSFLDSLKFELDEKSRREMPNYRERYAAAWNACQSKAEADKARAQQEVSKAEQHLSEASFGIEHIFRELGQIYEASLMANDKELCTNLAKAVARSIKLGCPFELMDGDVANVSLKWVERVFAELQHMLGDKRLLTLSILGLQSSGKSTLLNAMFGLTFSVSAGRCTRGIYVQLFPVRKQKFKFDYVLVVDTEGLRAPELSDQKYQHDNELATLVLGMADITIVNIKGENTSEVKDILQICVHAFLRLKMANQSLQLRQSCIFIHQNVSDVGAKDSMIHARKKIAETLDRMTLEAAEEECISDIKCFKDVIKFDSNHHVWYFSDLWKGDPPMAPANPGYSRDVRQVKSFIFETLTQNKDSYLTISDSFVHIKDLWNGILANDFIFSFRNSLEIRAYNALEIIYQDLIWKLERYAKHLTNSAEIEMKQCTADCETDIVKGRGIDQYTGHIHNKYPDDFQKKQSELKGNLKNYFKKGDKKDEITKWKHSKLLAWDLFAVECLGKLKRQLTDIESHCKVDYEMNTSLTTLQNEIYDQATTLAEHMKGKRLSPQDMETGFNEMWDKWIRKIYVQEEHCIEVKVVLKSILFATFNKHQDVVETEIKKHPLGHHPSFTTLENSLNDIGFDHNYISVKTTFFKRMKNVLRSGSEIESEIYNEAIDFTNIILKDIDVIFRDLKKREWKFDATEMKEIPKRIMRHIYRHNHDKSKTFTLLEPYTVTLCVHVFRYALPLLERLDLEYRKKYSMKAKLSNHKALAWRHFKDVVDEKSATLIACDKFCEIIRNHVEEKIKRSLPDLLYDHIVTDSMKAKYVLINRIMEDLVKINKLKAFMSYIHDPYTYAFEWLSEYIDSKCFGRSGNMYMDKVSAELQTTFEVIKKSVEKKSASCLHDWLINVQSEMKKGMVWIQMESLVVVENQKITDLNDFIATVKRKLEQVRSELKGKFQSETETSIR
ncbi:interferon-induced very large GTPase 1-like, partial [Mizuhopecten yessoensis]|uniref:interferon-induced very large GTPase 1-like n=1 Tax=Mizuhopecten yessoensis TaxID=6573 RepID=UPI000B45968E